MSTGLEYDVVVVGGGGAGFAAAVTASEYGARTVLLERQPRAGGTTAMSIGSFTAAGTVWQRHRGIKDDPDALLADMAAIPGVDMANDNPDLRGLLAAEGSRTLEWLAQLGVPFVGPFREPPHSVPRMHNVVPDSRMYIARLRLAAQRGGVVVLTNARAVELLRGGDLRPCRGVRVEVGGRTVDVAAKRGVVIATGDFSGNAAMRRVHLSAAAADAVPVNPASSGDGHHLIEAVGGQFRSMHVTTGPKPRFLPVERRALATRRPLWPPIIRIGARLVQSAYPGTLTPYIKSMLVACMEPSPLLFKAGAILVNLDGRRFCDENTSTQALTHERDGTGYVICDARIAAQFSKAPNYVSTAPGIAYAYLPDYDQARPDLVHRAPDARRLGKAIGLDPDAVEESVRSSQGLTGSRLVALGPVSSTVTVTEGGAVVDTQCRVLGQNGRSIAGLFAAGGVAQGGMQLAGHGLHIAWAMTSGRVAGAGAAQRLDEA